MAASENAGESFFTIYKAFWWLIYNLITIGFVSTWIFINVNVLGNDVELRTPTYQKR